MKTKKADLSPSALERWVTKSHVFDLRQGRGVFQRDDNASRRSAAGMVSLGQPHYAGSFILL